MKKIYQPQTISSLILMSLFATNLASAKAVVEYPTTDVLTEDAAKNILATPTIDKDSTYQLEEYTTEADEGIFTITKYLKLIEGNYSTFTPVSYNLLINDLGEDDANDSTYYKWVDDGNGNLSLEEVADVTSSSDYDLKVNAATSDNTRLQVTATDDEEDINHSFAGLSDDDSTIGGAIINKGPIGDINGDFVSNTITLDDSTGGGAIGNYAGTIGAISGSFIGNEVHLTSSAGVGGAINNTENGTISSITADFIGNHVISSADSGISGSGAIYNSTGHIGNITGDFIGNYVSSTGNSAAYGGAINSRSYATIGNITGDFIGNYVSTLIGSTKAAKGGAIFTYSHAEIGDITGDFIGNYAEARTDNALGGAIANTNLSEIGVITGSFVDNYVSSTTKNARGGAIYNISSSEIKSIVGDFINNTAVTTTGTSSGGAIYNTSTIGSIEGDFIGNQVETGDGSATSDSTGGAIHNSDTIGDIQGSFIGNSVITTSVDDGKDMKGGAIYNTGTMGNIEGDFIGNYIISGTNVDASNLGAAIYNEGSIALLARDSDCLIEDNYSVDADGSNLKYEAIYNANANSTIYMNAYDDKSITVNDKIVGVDGNAGTININSGTWNTDGDQVEQVDGKTFGVVEFNNEVRNTIINVEGGILKLGKSEAPTYQLEDGTEVQVKSSSAMLWNCTLNVKEGAIVQTKADYLYYAKGSDGHEKYYSTITNAGRIELNGGALSNNILGTGTIAVISPVIIEANIETTSYDISVSAEDVGANIILNGGSLAAESIFSVYLEDDFIIEVDKVLTLIKDLKENTDFSKYDIDTVMWNDQSLALGVDYKTMVVDNSLQIQFLTTIPEPSTNALILGALALISSYRRRKK